MQDDQWPYPPNRGGQRQRDDGPPAGSAPPQRPGPGRPPNAAPPNTPNGRPSGSLSDPRDRSPQMTGGGSQRPPQQQRPGGSGAIPRPPAQGDGWGTGSTSTTSQRRGPSGPVNPARPPSGPQGGARPPQAGGPPPNGGQPRGSTNTFPTQSGGQPRRPSGPTAPGGQRPPARGQSWEEEEQRWLGPENARPSRSISSPVDVPGARRGGGQTTQWGGAGRQRPWADHDGYDDDQPGAPGGRAAAQRRATGAPPAGRPGQRRSDGTSARGGWVVDTPEPKAPNTLRTRLLLTLLLVIVLLGGGVFAVPSLRARVLRHIAGLGSTSPGQTTGNTGTLLLQVNVPNAKVTLDKQPITLQPGQNGGFASASVPNLALGDHDLGIHADNFTDITTKATIKAGDNPWTAWLAPTSDALTAALKQFSPSLQPDDGKQGDRYGSPAKVAAGALTVSISYTLSGLDPKNFTSQMTAGNDTTKSPFQAAPVTLVPVITFKDANGTALATYSPTALPAAQFAVQALPGVNDKGAAQISIAGISAFKTSGGQQVTTDFSGPTQKDWALFYAIASVLPASPANALTFKCIGAVDNKNFNPEDGLFLVEGADDINHAHYFYRWGILWATNGIAQTLTPNAPRAQGNEFDDANTARANASCGS